MTVGAPTPSDSLGNVYVTGLFDGTADLDPGPGIDNHTSNGNWDIYLSKFDASGNFLWARTWGGNDDDARDVASQLILLAIVYMSLAFSVIRVTLTPVLGLITIHPTGGIIPS